MYLACSPRHAPLSWSQWWKTQSGLLLLHSHICKTCWSTPRSLPPRRNTHKQHLWSKSKTASCKCHYSETQLVCRGKKNVKKLLKSTADSFNGSDLTLTNVKRTSSDVLYFNVKRLYTNTADLNTLRVVSSLKSLTAAEVSSYLLSLNADEHCSGRWTQRQNKRQPAEEAQRRREKTNC